MTARTPQRETDFTLPPADALARADLEFTLRRLADDLAFGTDASRFVGGGLEYAGSRPYQPGDSIRLFDWRLTARTGRPFVREHEAMKRTCMYVALDTSASMAVASTPLRKHDIAFWMAAAIGLVGQRRMSPVAIVGAGERTSPPEPSLRQSDLWRDLDPLRAPGFAESTLLALRIADLAARAERTSVLVVLSDLHDPDAVGAIRHAAQRHDCVVIHTLDPIEVEPLRAGFVRAREAETGRAFLGTGRSRHAPAGVRDELLRCGVEYLAVRTDESFLPALRSFLSSRGGARGTR